MNVSEKQRILDVLNSLDVIETSGGDEAYVLVANNEENRKQLNAVGVSSETINKYGDEETFCILALGFSEGYVDLYDGNNLILFEEKFEIELDKGKSIILYKQDGDYYLAISEDGGSVSIAKLTAGQIKDIKNVIA